MNFTHNSTGAPGLHRLDGDDRVHTEGGGRLRRTGRCWTTAALDLIPRHRAGGWRGAGGAPVSWKRGLRTAAGRHTVLVRQQARRDPDREGLSIRALTKSITGSIAAPCHRRWRRCWLRRLRVLVEEASEVLEVCRPVATLTVDRVACARDARDFDVWVRSREPLLPT